jgi:hypothetical protein
MVECCYTVLFMLTVVFAGCYCAECHDECHDVECRYAEYHGAKGKEGFDPHPTLTQHRKNRKKINFNFC